MVDKVAVHFSYAFMRARKTVVDKVLIALSAMAPVLLYLLQGHSLAATRHEVLMPDHGSLG